MIPAPEAEPRPGLDKVGCLMLKSCPGNRGRYTQMTSARDKMQRTLVRGLCRIPGESRMEFKNRVFTLKKYFEQYNVNVSELCQWFIPILKQAKNGDQLKDRFREVFLAPGPILEIDDEDLVDKIRTKIFKASAGFVDQSGVMDLYLPEVVTESIRGIASMPKTQTAQKLFDRLQKLNESHLTILLKECAEWVIAHYLRQFENYLRQREEWEKEKIDWEAEHPQLALAVREAYNIFFNSIGVKEKRPKICSWKKISDWRENCDFNGEKFAGKNHGAICKKYFAFRDDNEKARRKDYFFENIERYRGARAKDNFSPKQAIITRLFLSKESRDKWFPECWDNYLKALGVQEATVLANWPLHCRKPSQDCEFNPHTEICKNYRQFLCEHPELQDMEELYRREWRAEYLHGPKKPSFQYPSSRTLPVPKIFGKDYFKVDFNNSIVGLRLDDMPEGKFLNFRFKPWPKDYHPQPHQTEITSLHINFIGTRARVGFRFKVPHRPSSFNLDQDELNLLRSRKYPRPKQDQDFLNEARQKLIESFQPEPNRELRLLAVDLGSGGGAIASFQGKKCLKSDRLKIVKIEKLYERRPEPDPKIKVDKKKIKEKGLGKEHVGRHIESWVEAAKKIAKKRGEQNRKQELGGYDLRRLSLHIRWMIRDWARLNASQIIKKAEENDADLIVFESMRGFSAPGRDKLYQQDKKRRMAFFAYGLVRRKVTEKAVERGMRVITVPYKHSSLVCSECGKLQSDPNLKNKLGKRIFRCEYCSFALDSDENAARVLAKVFWGDIVLPPKRIDLTNPILPVK